MSKFPNANKAAKISDKNFKRNIKRQKERIKNEIRVDMDSGSYYTTIFENLYSDTIKYFSELGYRILKKSGCIEIRWDKEE